MIALFDPIRGIDTLSVLLKILLSCLFGALVGLERSTKNRPAGFRTHILVCMGAAVAALTGLYLYLGLKLPADISRISGQVISGLGFIGAGTIVVTRKMTIKGLTTAAGLWTTGIIGLAVGSGYVELAILGTALVLSAETWMTRISARIQTSPEYVVEILYNEKNSLDQVLRHCKDKHMSIVNLKIQSQSRESSANYAAVVTLRGAVKSEDMLYAIHHMPGIVSAVSL